jgi:hypothetical protein
MIRDIITGYPFRAIATGQKMPQTHQKSALAGSAKTGWRMLIELLN